MGKKTINRAFLLALLAMLSNSIGTPALCYTDLLCHYLFQYSQAHRAVPERDPL